MNTDQRRALAFLKTIYPEKEHERLETDFRNFVIKEGSKYFNPIDLVEAYLNEHQ